MECIKGERIELEESDLRSEREKKKRGLKAGRVVEMPKGARLPAKIPWDSLDMTMRGRASDGCFGQARQTEAGWEWEELREEERKGGRGRKRERKKLD